MSPCSRNCSSVVPGTKPDKLPTWILPDYFACPACINTLVSLKADSKRKAFEASFPANRKRDTVIKKLGLSKDLAVAQIVQVEDAQRTKLEKRLAEEMEQDRQSMLNLGRNCQLVSFEALLPAALSVFADEKQVVPEAREGVIGDTSALLLHEREAMEKSWNGKLNVAEEKRKRLEQKMDDIEKHARRAGLM